LMWVIGGEGRVYVDCWYSLGIVGEPFDYAQGIARPYKKIAIARPKQMSFSDNKLIERTIPNPKSP